MIDFKNSRLFEFKWLIFFAFSLIGFFLISYFTIPAYDDFNYKFIYDAFGLTNHRVESLSDVFRSQYHHYFVFCGRVLVHIIVQFFLMFDNKLWFDIANTLVFGFFQVGVLLNSGLFNRKLSLRYYSILILFIWFLLPGHNYCMFWVSGSVNYMWAVTFALFFFYIHTRISAVPLNKPFQLLSLFIVGFLLTATHEIVSISISVSFFIYYLFNYSSLNRSKVSLVLGSFGATLFAGLSPANFNRAIYFTTGAKQSFQTVIVSNESHLFILLKSTIIFILLAIVFFILYIKNRNLFWKLLSKNQLFFGAIIVSLAFAYFINAINQRAIFPATVFALVILMSVLVENTQYLRSRLITIVLIFSCLFLLYEFETVVVDVAKNKKSYLHDMSIIKNSNKKQTLFEFSQFQKNRFICYSNLNNCNREWGSNNGLSLLYSKPFIVFFPSNIYQYVCSLDTISTKINGLSPIYYLKSSSLLLIEVPYSLESKINAYSIVEFYQQQFYPTHMLKKHRIHCRFFSTKNKSYVFFFVNKDFQLSDLRIPTTLKLKKNMFTFKKDSYCYENLMW